MRCGSSVNKRSLNDASLADLSIVTDEPADAGVISYHRTVVDPGSILNYDSISEDALRPDVRMGVTSKVRTNRSPGANVCKRL